MNRNRKETTLAEWPGHALNLVEDPYAVCQAAIWLDTEVAIGDGLVVGCGATPLTALEEAQQTLREALARVDEELARRVNAILERSV